MVLPLLLASSILAVAGAGCLIVLTTKTVNKVDRIGKETENSLQTITKEVEKSLQTINTAVDRLTKRFDDFANDMAELKQSVQQTLFLANRLLVLLMILVTVVICYKVHPTVVYTCELLVIHIPDGISNELYYYTHNWWIFEPLLVVYKLASLGALLFILVLCVAILIDKFVYYVNDKNAYRDIALPAAIILGIIYFGGFLDSLWLRHWYRPLTYTVSLFGCMVGIVSLLELIELKRRRKIKPKAYANGRLVKF